MRRPHWRRRCRPRTATVQSMPDASPVKWHLAHTTWFFETFMLARTSRATAVRSGLRLPLQLATTTRVGERHPRPQRGMLSRPGAGRRCSPTAREVDARCSTAARAATMLDGRCARAGRARPAARAAAPGTDADRPQARCCRATRCGRPTASDLAADAGARQRPALGRSFDGGMRRDRATTWRTRRVRLRQRIARATACWIEPFAARDRAR